MADERNKIQNGSVVRLKGGSEIMTAYAIKDKSAWCAWQHNGEHKANEYLLIQLELVSDKEIENHRKDVRNRLNAAVGASFSDKVAKWGTFINAIVSIGIAIAISITAIKIDEINKTISSSPRIGTNQNSKTAK